MRNYIQDDDMQKIIEHLVGELKFDQIRHYIFTANNIVQLDFISKLYNQVQIQPAICQI